MLLRGSDETGARTANARPAYPWRDAVVFGLVTATLYAVLPALAPVSVESQMGVVVLGIVLGIAVGLGLRHDPRVAPIGGLAAFVALSVRSFAIGSPVRESVPIAAVIGLEVWALIYLIHRTHAERLQSPQDVLLLVGVALGVGVIAGLAASTLLASAGQLEEHFLHGWRTWVLDTVFGLVCIAPAFMTLHRPRSWSWRFAVEYAIVCTITGAVTFYMFRVVVPGDPGLFGWPYLVILGPLWLAARMGVAAMTPVAAVVMWFAAASTVVGVGAFAIASSDAADRLVAVQLFCIVMTITLLLVAVLHDSRLRSMKRLRDSARLLREVIDGTAALVFAKSFEESDPVDGRYVLVNQAWREQFGVEADETLGHSDAELFNPEIARAHVDADRKVLAASTPVVVVEGMTNQQGDPRIYSTSKFPLIDDDGHAWGVGGIATDTTDLVRAVEREQRQGELLRAVFELSPTPAMRLLLRDDAHVTVLAVNNAMCDLMSARGSGVDECDLLSHVHDDDVCTALDVLSVARNASPGRADILRQRELRLRTNDDRVVWVLMSAASVGSEPAEGGVELVAQFENFTARRLAEEALTDQALRDVVTGLPNRRALLDRLESALQRLRRNPGLVAVLFCDLDHFKDVNDTLGHQAGDQFLGHVARRMQAALRPEDTVARLGGDEFVALGEGIADPAAAMQMAIRLQEKISGPWLQDGQSFRASVSIGIAVIDDPDISADEVLRRADLAMYRAKANGRSRIEFYERSVDEQYQHAVAIQHDLRKAIDTGSLFLHYQPIVSLPEGSVLGAEALVRMTGRDGTVLAPAWFVPQAETSGLIVPMGAWVVRHAIDQLHIWSAAGRDVTVSVNVSPSQLRDEGFATYVLSQIAAVDVDPEKLAVEVTETALLNEPDRSARELTALSREGVGIYLDDFGTGYSSLSWLTQFPVDAVKIDRSFIDELGIDDRKSAIVAALIQVSHELGFAVVAEGVETTAQADRLIDLGCDRGQGFLFGRPVPVDEPPWSL